MKRTSAGLLWAAALLILCGALAYFNLPAARPAAQTTAEAEADPAGEDDRAALRSDAPAGYHVGERLPDFTLTCVDGSVFTLSEHLGQPVVINLWATWCGPCVRELPLFDALWAKRAGDVAVLAIHSDMITDDVQAYLSGYGYRMPFAVDEDGGVIAAMGGSAMLPQTLVLNTRGEVVYNQVGSVTYEALEELVGMAESN